MAPSNCQNLPDSELVRLSQTGSLAAFEELVYRYQDRLYRFVANGCGNHADAREITQDAFVRAFQAIAQFDPAQSFAPWLFTIARHKSIDHYRAAPPAANDLIPDLPGPDNPAETLERREESENLWQLARRRLSPVQFQALWLKYAEDLSVADIARVLHKSPTHVKVLLFRARLALGRELNAAGLVPRPAPAAAATTTRTRAPEKPALDPHLLGRWPTVKP